MQAPMVVGQRELEGMDALLDLPMDDECLNQLLGSGGAGARPADKGQVPPRSSSSRHGPAESIEWSSGSVLKQWLARLEVFTAAASICMLVC